MEIFASLDPAEALAVRHEPVSVGPAPVAEARRIVPPVSTTALATPSATRTEIAITNELGTFVIELFEDTPTSTAKFLDNVVRDVYSGGTSSVQGDAFIHRLEANFVLQGGGYYQNGNNTYIPINTSITGELGVHANSIYTLSWALTGTDQASAGGQWFINLQDNSALLSQFPVFGQLVGASAAFNATIALPTVDFGGPFTQLPVLHGATAQTFTTNDLVRVTYDVLGVAAADSGSTAENAVLSGSSVFANDSDMDSALAIALVNGSAVSFGSAITLMSGAKLTVNANGTYSYDPNHVFDALNNGQTATDTFTYTLAGGHLVRGTATVAITINGVSAATPPNQAPAGTDKTIEVTQRVNYHLTLADFGFTDTDGNAFASVVVNTYPDRGRLLYQAVLGGSATFVLPGQEFSAADIAAGKIIYLPTARPIGPGGSFTFSVRDNGGTANGGVDLDPTPNTMTFHKATAVARVAASDHDATGDAFGWKLADGGVIAVHDMDALTGIGGLSIDHGLILSVDAQLDAALDGLLSLAPIDHAAGGIGGIVDALIVGGSSLAPVDDDVPLAIHDLLSVHAGQFLTFDKMF